MYIISREVWDLIILSVSFLNEHFLLLDQLQFVLLLLHFLYDRCKAWLFRHEVYITLHWSATTRPYNTYLL